MKYTPRSFRTGHQTGFTLIEVLVSILICSIGLLGIVGLRATAIQHSVGSDDMNRAVMLAEEIAWRMQDLRTTSLPPSVLAAWQLRVQDPIVGFANGLGSGSVSSPPDANGAVTVTITWSPPGAASGATAHQYITEVAVP